MRILIAIAIILAAIGIAGYLLIPQEQSPANPTPETTSTATPAPVEIPDDEASNTAPSDQGTSNTATGQRQPPSAPNMQKSYYESDPGSPSLQLIYPLHQATIEGAINIQAKAETLSSVAGVRSVKFFVNGELLSEDRGVPFEATLNTEEYPNGTIKLSAEAHASDGTYSNQTIWVTVANPPKITGFRSDDLSVAEGHPTTLHWSSEGANTCQGKEGWSGTKPTRGSETFTLYRSTTYVLECSNSAGAITRSVSVGVTGSAPTVVITSPPSGSIVKNEISVTANAADDAAVYRVEFYLDSQLINTDETAPYSAIIDTASLEDGRYTIQARAHDYAGNVGTADITINASNGNF